MRPGFKRAELKSRYDVPLVNEDAWHAHSGSMTGRIVRNQLGQLTITPRRLLNAGAGCYELTFPFWSEVLVDIFPTPLRKRDQSICANIEMLPFASSMFGCAVCVGEVLAYCDPALAISEFARVLVPSGILICDFGNSRGIRFRGTAHFNRAADLITDYYNGSDERVWIYNPDYIKELLLSNNFDAVRIFGTHTWSAIGRQFGLSVDASLKIEKHLRWLKLPTDWSDLMTIVAIQKKT